MRENWKLCDRLALICRSILTWCHHRPIRTRDGRLFWQICPPVTFGCVYQHFEEPSTNAPSVSATAAEEHVAATVVTPLQHPTAAAMHSQHAATPTGNWDEETLSSFRGLSKGYRFFKDGHVQVLEMHPLPDHPHFVYVRASVLPSMVKTRLYKCAYMFDKQGVYPHSLLRVSSRFGWRV